MDELFRVVERVRERIRRYGGELRRSEALTRYVLVDPVLRALGWDTEDPEAVRPEERQEGGVPDYILLAGGRRLIALEVKSLGRELGEEKALELGFRYSWKNKIPWFAVTDGSTWRVYDVREVGGRLALEVRIAEEPVEEVVRKLFSLSRRLVASGGIREVGVLEPGQAREGSKEQAVEHGPKSVKCPYCGYEADASIFKLLRSPWRYGFYEVRMLECPECHGTFNHYHGVSPKGRVSEYVIRVKPGIKG